MRILITGGAGFIGSHLVEYHLKKGDEVFVVDDLTTGTIDNVKLFQNNTNFQFAKADILTWNNLANVIDWSERVYHLAAVVGVFYVLKNPIKVIESNFLGCSRILNMVANSKSHPRVIVASSSSVYGNNPHSPLSEKDSLILKTTDVYKLGGYAVSKVINENLSLAYNHHKDVSVNPVRIFNTIGPRQTGKYGMVVPRFIQQACQNEPLTVFGDGKQTRSFCDVRDTVTALDILASNSASIGEIVNLGNDEEININDLAKLIISKTHSKSQIQHQSYREAYGEKFIDLKRRIPDLQKFFQLTQFKHQWTLQKTIDDLIMHYGNSK